jgi:drug/metabolite transporter (DMT)-like permease
VSQWRIANPATLPLSPTEAAVIEGPPPRVSLRAPTLVGAALVAFAGNSILCRAALASGRTDPATCTLVRIGAGAATLFALARLRRTPLSSARGGVVPRSIALFAYAALFSFAYVRIPAGVGALVLFACVQLTMIAAAIREHAGPRGSQWIGIALALAGLAALTLPGAAAPDAVGVALMAASGVAWGVYTLRGRRASAPLATTATSFLGAAPLAMLAAAILAATGGLRFDAAGLAVAAASGAITSGLGYAVWYAALPSIGTTRAAVVQLAVPVLAAFAGVVILGESASVRLALSSAAILGGIAITIVAGRARIRTPAAEQVRASERDSASRNFDESS